MLAAGIAAGARVAKRKGALRPLAVAVANAIR
jgi:hypothetical protein